MAIYEWICRECELLWDREYPMGKAPQRTKCPECKSLSPRNFEVNFSFKDDGAFNKGKLDMGFHTLKRRYEKHHKLGYDKTSGDRFLHRSIKEVKDRVESQERHYTSYNMNIENLAKDGKITKLNDKQAQARKEKLAHYTKQAYDLAAKQGKDVDVNRRPTQH